MNDEINKRMREKRHWEDQILELGGPNYKKIGPRMLDHEGKEVPGNRGYRYYGAARDLPGVRELFQTETVVEKRRLRGQLFTHIDADYYGYRDEEDAILVPLEAEAEQQAIAQAMEEWEAKKAKGQAAKDDAMEDGEEDALYAAGIAADTAERDAEEVDIAEMDAESAHVEVPTMEDMEQALLARKKELLMAQYASTEMMEDTATIKELAQKK